MKILSVFTGAGGLDLGLEAAGFTIAGAVEIDEHAQATLRLNRPKWKLAEPGDLFAYKPDELLESLSLRKRDIFLLSGGPPCQPFSKSSFWNGDTLRLEDPRSKTIRSYLRLCGAALPYAILLENVEGLLFEGKDEGLKLILQRIKQINNKHGTKYDAQIIKINSAENDC